MEGTLTSKRIEKSFGPNLLDPIDKRYHPMVDRNVYILSIRVGEKTGEMTVRDDDYDSYTEGERVKVRYYELSDKPDTFKIERVEKLRATSE